MSKPNIDELRRETDSQTRRYPLQMTQAAAPTYPASLETIRLRNLEWDTKPPPPVDFLIEGVLPMKTTGVIGGAGGSSKTQLVLQIGIGIAAGGVICPGGGSQLWFPQKPREVLILSAEENSEDLHRRIHAIAQANAYTNEQNEKMRQNLCVTSVRGHDNLLTRKRPDGEIEQTERARELLSLAKRMRNPGLIVFKPLSRFRGGEELSNETGTRLIEVMELLSLETGATVLTAAHVNKASMGNDDLGQDAIRGASSIVDGCRWAAVMRTMTLPEAKEYAIGENKRARYVKLAIPKANNVPPQPTAWLERGMGGYLMKTKPRPRKEIERESEYEQVLREVVELLEKHKNDGLTVNKLETEHGGLSGLFGVGGRKLRSILNRAIEEGRLAKDDKDGSLMVHGK